MNIPLSPEENEPLSSPPRAESSIFLSKIQDWLEKYYALFAKTVPEHLTISSAKMLNEIEEKLSFTNKFTTISNDIIITIEKIEQNSPEEKKKYKITWCPVEYPSKKEIVLFSQDKNISNNVLLNALNKLDEPMSIDDIKKNILLFKEKMLDNKNKEMKELFKNHVESLFSLVINTIEHHLITNNNDKEAKNIFNIFYNSFCNKNPSLQNIYRNKIFTIFSSLIQKYLSKGQVQPLLNVLKILSQKNNLFNAPFGIGIGLSVENALHRNNYTEATTIWTFLIKFVSTINPNCQIIINSWDIVLFERIKTYLREIYYMDEDKDKKNYEAKKQELLIAFQNVQLKEYFINKINEIDKIVKRPVSQRPLFKRGESHDSGIFVGHNPPYQTDPPDKD